MLLQILISIILALIFGIIAYKRFSTISPKPISHPKYYGYIIFVWSFILSISLLLIIANKAIYIALLASLVSLFIFLISSSFKARQHFEGILKIFFRFCTLFCISLTFLIFISIFSESLDFFKKVPVGDFLFGLKWSPQTSIRADQAGSSGSFGAIPVFIGTLLITFIAIIVAGPIGLFAAIFLSEYATPKFRNITKPILEMLAGIPTVVYGYFAAATFAPSLVDFGNLLNLEINSESAISAGIVMGIMIIPFVMSLSDDVMSAVPKSLREGSLGLGATKSETIKKVVIPAAFPGIVGAILLAVSRAIGETMIVVMAAGLAANLTLNPFDSVTTVTTQIVTLLVGDQSFDSAKTLSAFGLSLTLFFITLILNVIAILVVKKYQEKYE